MGVFLFLVMSKVLAAFAFGAVDTQLIHISQKMYLFDYVFHHCHREIHIKCVFICDNDNGAGGIGVFCFNNVQSCRLGRIWCG